MEMTGTAFPVPSYMIDGARRGRAAVAGALGAGIPGFVVPGDADESMAAAGFVAHLMFTVQLANGMHPRSCTDFVLDETRGGDLARGFLTAGTVEICCDYCAGLMVASLTMAASQQMRALHGDQAAYQWEALWLALTGPPF